MQTINIDALLEETRLLGCSDLHFTTNIPPVVRLHGSLRKLSSYPEMTNDAIMAVAAQMTNTRQLASIKAFIDTDFSFVSKTGYRHRVNVYHQRGQVGIAIRLLRNDIPTLKDLSLPPVVSEFVMRPRGLILVTGPTGSGKSTSLAAMIDYINEHRSARVITIEDPIEYVHEHKRCMINQREVGADVDSFAGALRAALREDPDVILVGEMRDYETITAAVTAAETGHLVMSTLHTTSAADTVNRIIDVFPAHQQAQIRTQLAATLVGIMTQTLVPTSDGEGRMAATEILYASDAIAAMIRDGKTHMIPSAIQTGKSQGMMCLDQSLAKLVNDGVITVDSAIERCASKVDLQRFMGNRYEL